MTVRILGGGVAGLAGALALRRRGFEDVVVLERDTPAELLARPGHGMILMRNGLAALRALGADGCLADHRALRRAVFEDERGRIQRCESLDGVYCVTRRGLVDALRSELPDAGVEHGRRVANVLMQSARALHPHDADRRVRAIGFADGSSLDAAGIDLVVGADGSRSALAAALNPGPPRARSRVFEVVMSAREPELSAWLGDVFVKTLIPQRGLAFGLLSPSPGDVIGFLQFDVRRHGVPSCAAGCGVVDFAAALLGRVPATVSCFLEAADRSTAHLWRPVDAEPAPTSAVSNAVLIGDAAHPLLPFCSQGVGAALDDAVLLADAIAIGRGARLPQTLAAFCAERRREVAPFVDGGRRILANFVGGSPGFLAPYVHAFVRPTEPDAAADEDPLFADSAVDLATLRKGAYNHRWAMQRKEVIPLTAAGSDFPACAEIIEAVQRHLATGYLPYGPSGGLPELRRNATDALWRRHRLPCSPNTLLPTDGAASAVFLATRLALRRPGDEAIVPDPVDFLLERAVSVAGGVARRWRVEDGRFDVVALEALVTPRTRLISLCNPHNPLGRVLRRDELEAIAEVALRHKLWILSDEVWSYIVYAPHEHVSIASLAPEVAARTFTVFGFSKSYGMAGMRLGMLAAPDAAQRRRLLTLANAQDTVFGVNTLSQVAGAAAYELGDAWLERWVAHLQRRRDQAVARLNSIGGVRCAEPEGTFVAFPDVSALGVDQDPLAAHLLDRHDVAIVPGSPEFFGPGAAGHLRISFATSRGILDAGLDRIEAGLRSARRVAAAA